MFNTHVRHGITHCVVVYSNMRDWRPISYTNRARRMRGTMNPFTRDQRRQGGTHAAATRPRAPGRQRECLEWYRGTQARGDASAADGRAEGTLHRGTSGQRSVHRWLPFTRRRADGVSEPTRAEGGRRRRRGGRIGYSGTQWEGGGRGAPHVFSCCPHSRRCPPQTTGSTVRSVSRKSV